MGDPDAMTITISLRREAKQREALRTGPLGGTGTQPWAQRA
jgi:hypothetical protein